MLKIEYCGTLRWRTTWNAGRKDDMRFPQRPSGKSVVDTRVTLQAAPWSALGWSQDSLGYAFWYEGAKKIPRLLYGSNIIKECEHDKMKGISSPRCTMVHMISHRYSQGNKTESGRDRLTYHSLALLEWDHGMYCTVVEGAYLNGASGNKGKSNWYDDKDEAVTSLYKDMPPAMIAPWKSDLSEIRLYDVKARNLEEFLTFMEHHTGKLGRFLNVRCTFSHIVRLTFCSKEHIAQYLINYIKRSQSYSELSQNCETFAAG